jgi:lipoprotein-anchoring transpeptidase ErfK/SrfK
MLTAVAQANPVAIPSVPSVTVRPSSRPAATTRPTVVRKMVLPTSQPAAARKATPPATSSDIAAIDRAVREAQSLVKIGKLLEARTLCNKTLAEYADTEPAKLAALRELTLDLGQKTITGPRVTTGDPLCQSYTIEPGDLLQTLARQGRVPYLYLCRINKISDPSRIYVGQKIKLLRGPITAVVSKAQFRMDLYLQDVLFASYPVGLGGRTETPVGTWLVEDRVKNPEYRDPDTGKIYPPGAKDSPIGYYWLRLKGLTGQTVGRTGFGIHGTNEPESIGKKMSKGCIRMNNADVAEVYEMLWPGVSKVTVK